MSMVVSTVIRFRIYYTKVREIGILKKVDVKCVGYLYTTDLH